MNKDTFNKIRVTICLTCIICAIIIWLATMGFRLYVIISNNEAYKEISLKLMGGPLTILMLILLSISTIVALYNSKKYGRIRFSTEYRTPIVIPYQFNIKDNLIKYLTSNKYIEGNCSLTTMNVRYFIKMDNNRDVHLYAFLKNNKINQTILNEYKENYLTELLDFIADQEEKVIKEFMYYYVYFIASIKETDDEVEEIINYNQITHGYVILMPIIINQSEKKIYIADYNDGLGQILYKNQQKLIIERLKTLDEGTIPLDE